MRSPNQQGFARRRGRRGAGRGHADVSLCRADACGKDLTVMPRAHSAKVRSSRLRSFFRLFVPFLLLVGAATVPDALHSPAGAAAPSITGVTATSLTGSAILTWTTDTASDSQVDYGSTSSYGTSTILDPNATTAHSQGLSGLQTNTLYHYRVKSRDAS